VAPAGPVYQAGTLSGNPLAMAAGLKTLEVIRRPGFYQRLESQTQKLAQGLSAAAGGAGVALHLNQVGSMFTPFLAPSPVTDYATAKRANTQGFARFFRSLLDRGVYLPPSQFEASFVSAAHTEADFQETIEASKTAFSGLAEARSAPS
jgi:glutamate-1-semialdehyde 2,1-aminomutase